MPSSSGHRVEDAIVGDVWSKVDGTECGYRFLTLFLPPTDARTLAAQIGLAKAMRKYDLRRLITFHSSVAKAARFVDATQPDSLPGVISHLTPSARPSGTLWAKHISGHTPTLRGSVERNALKTLWAKHISGHTPAGQRATLLNGLGHLPSGTRGIISNCACLGEGVDVPVLDGVAFIDIPVAVTGQRRHNACMKAISIHELHEETDQWVRQAAQYGEILVTDSGKSVAKLVPWNESPTRRSFKDWQPSPEFAAIMHRPVGGTESTQIISEDRDRT